MKKRVIVFGATGNLGAYIAVHLKNVGYDVIAVGRRKSDNNFFADRGMEYYSVNINDIENFDILPEKDIYAVCNFAGELPSRYKYDPAELFRSITIGNLNILNYMRRCGAKRIVFPTTPYDLAGYTNFPQPADLPRKFPLTGDHAVYTIAKNAAVDLMQHYKEEFGIDYFVLRFYTIYMYHPNPFHYADYKRRMMPYRMLMDRAMKGLPIEIWGDPSKAKEMVYIKDFTQIVELTLKPEAESGIYNVGNGWQVSLEEQIRGIVEVFSTSDNKSTITYRPELPDPLVNAFDISKTVEKLGYHPQYSYIDQLKDFKHEMETEPFAQLWGTKEDYLE